MKTTTAVEERVETERTTYIFKACASCERAPTVRFVRWKRRWFACCCTRSCPSRPSSWAASLRRCWQQWERL